MWKRWPRKREFLAYYILYRYTRLKNTNSINYGEALQLLRSVLGSKKVADNVIRGLVKQGLLRRIRPLYYEVPDIYSILDEAAVGYIALRLRRRGIEAYVDEREKCIRVENGAGNELSEIVNSLGYSLCNAQRSQRR